MAKAYRKAEKHLYSFYREYNIYRVIDGRGNIFYNAESPYLTEGFIDAFGDSVDECHRKIDKIYERVHLLNISSRGK